MRQVWIERKGGPEVLRVRESPDPEPRPGEVRIRVKGSGVNFADVMSRLGVYPDAPKIPFVPGYEVAGTIDLPRERAGERVMAMTRFGGYSDVVCVRAQQALPLPSSLSFSEGAAVPVNWLTAWHMLVELANLRAGQRVLIHAAAGGVGTAAVQICKRIGAESIGTASASKHARLRELGLTHAIDYRTQDFEQEVTRITGGRGVDVALDAVGGRSFSRSFRCLAPVGKLIMFGVSAAVVRPNQSRLRALPAFLGMPWFPPFKLLPQNKGVFGVNMGRLWGEAELLGRELREVLRGIEEGAFRPIVDGEFPLEEAGRAHLRLEERANFGKVLLVP